MHRRNAAERAIRTYKNHFVAGLSTCDPTFPMHLWCRLIAQANITLNLLRASRLNPQLSAYAQIFGQFDFNRTPLAPPGTRVLSHDKLANRTSWATHGEEGWYLGPAMEHYRCYRVFIIKTKAERDSDTVTFFPVRVTMPALSAADRAVRAANELIHALRNPHPASPLTPIGTEQLQGLEQLSEIFNTAAPRVGNKAKKPQTTTTGATTEVTNPSTTHTMQTRQGQQHQPHNSNQATLQPPQPPTPEPTIVQFTSRYRRHRSKSTNARITARLEQFQACRQCSHPP
jgi:hypothetical protein